ncbi:MAG TPA: VOC family protein [Thermoleophilaceae bacterium]|jgi:catechol 2,3-dioxygenase-like lactoylglutathione lyase family enzyme
MSVGSSGMHHMGLTVSDLDRSVAFYSRFGFEVTARIEEEGAEVEEGLGVPDAALRVAILESENSRLELIQYVKPDGGPAPLPNNGTGAAHLCVEVDDVDKAYEELRAAGIDFFSEPITHESGIRWVYCRDPDGLTTELLQVLT